MTGLLNGAVKILMLQMICGSRKAVPEVLFEKEKETLNELESRKSGIKGTQFIDSTRDVSLLQFLGDLASTGYSLVDAFYQMRTDAYGKENCVARFVFVSEDNLGPNSKFASHKEDAANALTQMCKQALWSVVAFLNPFFKDGNIVEDAHSISINCKGRNQIVDEQGNPLLRWQKDAAGESIGDEPIPVEPKKFLRILEDDIRVVSAP